MNPNKLRYTHRFKTEKAIRSTFEQQQHPVHALDELERLIESNRTNWELAPSARTKNVIGRLIKNKILFQHDIVFSEEESYTRYAYGEVSPYDLAVGLHPKAYLSHYSAAAFLNLTNQVPKTIYTTVEQSQRQVASGSELSQASIDRAFSLPQRQPLTKAQIGEYTIILLKGKHTNRTGVLTTETIPHTGVERTLIDLAVRPNYSGGAFAILDMYRQAVTQGIAAAKIVSWLEKFNYTYPYHQSIGFLLEKAGYTGKPLASLKAMPMPFNFYLDYEMTDTAYSKEWKLYYPKGM